MNPPGRSPRPRHWIAFALLLVLLGWISSSFAVAWRLTRRAKPPFEETLPFDLERTRRVRIRTSDGEQLGAWFLEGEPGTTCFLLLHGNEGRRGNWTDVLRVFEQEGLGALAPSLRAHGDSTGRTNDFGWSARLDVLACVQWLREREPSRPLVIAGFSLGAVAAIHAAPELADVRAYYLESPYPDLDTAMWRRLDSYLPPVLDLVAAAGLRAWRPFLLGHDPAAHSPWNR